MKLIEKLSESVLPLPNALQLLRRVQNNYDSLTIKNECLEIAYLIRIDIDKLVASIKAQLQIAQLEEEELRVKELIAEEQKEKKDIP